MGRKFAVLALGLALASVVMAGDEDKSKQVKAKVEGTMLQVNRKLDQKNYPFSGASVSVSALVTVSGKQILTVDSTASKLTEFRDDKDTDFLKAAGFFKPTFRQNSLATDRGSAVVGVGVFGTAPARGAGKILVKGSLVLICGTDEKTTEEKEVAMKDKSEATVGDFTIKVTQEKGFGTQGASFTISANSPSLKTVNVKDADGKTVETTTFGSPFQNFDKKWTVSYTLRKVVEKPKISISYFSKEEKVTVPVDLGVGVGL
jgi:hypothetical protein